MKRVYIAGPYSGSCEAEVEENVQRAISVGCKLLQMGYEPFVPHLSHYLDLELRAQGVTVNYDRWIDWCLAWVERCDALLFLGESPGAERELHYARDLGKTIYLQMGDIPNHALANADR